MSIGWIAPAALFGIGLVALPIAIHLLVRQHARTLAFPSLRFLRETQLAAFRRRTIQDAALLLCRIAIVALAAIALAGPVLQTAWRTAGYASRTSRAIVALEGIDDARLGNLAEGAFASSVIRRASIADALADAVRWLDRQAPSSREIVIAGVLRRGSIADGELAIVPHEIGVRFESVPSTSVSDLTWPVLTRRNGTLVRVNRAVHFEIDETRVEDGEAVEVPADLVSIVSRDSDAGLAQAALRAALDAGVSWSDFDRRTVIVWEGADEAAIEKSARTIRMPVPTPAASAADAVLAALQGMSPRPDRFEPVPITPEQLTAWSRPPSGVHSGATLIDEGDRRWVWVAVLIMLGLETWMRRSRSALASVTAETEARVA